MVLKFTTKRDASGNRYTLKIDPDTKTYARNYKDSWTYSDHITITKKDREKLIQQLDAAGYTQI